MDTQGLYNEQEEEMNELERLMDRIVESFGYDIYELEEDMAEAQQALLDHIQENYEEKS